ncbi:MAG: CDP-archaeol synthase [Candidatus Andersenbacteria bacterium]
MNILALISSAIWIYAPAMVANMAPVFAAKWNMFPWLNKPLDFGLMLYNIRVLGSHKTFRGLVVACIAGAITGCAQALIIHQNILFGLSVGFIFGFGAMFGDAIKSFCKRRLRIASGSSWIPFDQIDFVIGATLFGIFFIQISFPVFITAIFFISIASYVVSFVGVALHFKKSL